jgi:hypothetical protein
MVNTPGAGGYLIAWALTCLGLSCVIAGGTAVEVAGDSYDSGSPFSAALGVFVLSCFFSSLMSVPFAAIGIPVVHLACRKVAAQWVHVVVAGLVGLSPFLLVSLLSGEWWWFPYGAVAPAAALGRLGVTPFVWHRRNSAAPVPTG